MNMEDVIGRIVATMTTREDEGKEYGVIVIAEGLAELLPQEYLEGIGRDEHGHISISAVNLHKIFGRLIAEEYTAANRKEAEDYRLAARLRVPLREAPRVRRHARQPARRRRLPGTCRKESRRRDGLRLRPAQAGIRRRSSELVDPETLVTVVRFIELDSDFHKLTRFLETYVHG